jgi:hypothetical protein
LRGEEEYFMRSFDIGFALRHCDALCAIVARVSREYAA